MNLAIKKNKLKCPDSSLKLDWKANNADILRIFFAKLFKLKIDKLADRVHDKIKSAEKGYSDKMTEWTAKRFPGYLFKYLEPGQ